MRRTIHHPRLCPAKLAGISTRPSDSAPGASSRSSPTWLVRSQAVVVSFAVAGLLLLGAACGGSPSSNGASGSSKAGASSSTRLVAFAQCIRSNGVSSFPDPSSSGAIPKETPQQLGVSDSRFRSAENACRHLLPGGSDGGNEAQLQRVEAQGLLFAQCMRRHGVALPDPGADGRIPDPASVGIDQSSPRFQAGNQACGKYRPPYMPSNSAYNDWARTHAA